MAIDPIHDPSIIEGYLTDASNVSGHAQGLLRPKSAEEVSAIVRHCQQEGIPLTVSGARTSTTAASVPFGGWILSTEGLATLHEISHDTATAGPGILLGAFQAEIEATGRFFPPDPTSRFECTLGAAIACNASGARSFRYGATRPWIEALEVVLPTGEIRRFEKGEPLPADWPKPHWEEPEVKTAAGYSPEPTALDLFIGQEGTLGIITQATVRLTALPEAVIGLMAYFPDRETALRFVERSREAARSQPDGPLSPRCIEYLDHHCLELARARVGDVPEEAQAALFCEQEIIGEEEAYLEAWWEALEACGALADDTLFAADPAGQQQLHALRHAIPAGVNEEVIRNQMPKVGTDLAVPDESLRTMMDAYEASPLPYVLFGHIGDNHLHLNLLPKTAEELVIARAYYDDLAALAVAQGGTISAEHGVGKLKKKHLSMMLSSDTIASFKAIKSHLDPSWILGRGNLFDA
jgi:D-lactate dehydrogenase (cytochrome)